AAQGILAGICVVLGVGAPDSRRILQPLVSDLNPAGPALAQSWTLPTTALIPVTAATLAAGALWLWSSKLRGWPRTYVTWECGFGGLTPRMQVAANSFTQPV